MSTTSIWMQHVMRRTLISLGTGAEGPTRTTVLTQDAGQMLAQKSAPSDCMGVANDPSLREEAQQNNKMRPRRGSCLRRGFVGPLAVASSPSLYPSLHTRKALRSAC